MATYDYPYFNLRLTWGEVEAEILRRAKTRAVGGLYSWRASGARGGWRGFSLHQRVPPTHHPRWYSNIAYDNTPSALKAVLDEFDPARSASRALSPFHWRVASFQRPLQCTRTSYRSNLADRCPSGPRSTFTEYALPTGRGLTCGDG